MYNSLLKGIKEALMPTGIQIETGIFSQEAPDEYLVIIPMGETYDFFADDLPSLELQEARLSLFSKENYMPRKNEVVKVLLKEGFTITERRYVGYEEDTEFHHFAIDVSKVYKVNHEV